MPAFPTGSFVRLNSAGRGLLRKLMQHGGGHVFTRDGQHFTEAEADGCFEVMGDDGLRNSVVRSLVSGREGLISHGLIRLARPHECRKGR
jgi:hypothetical protein